MLTALTLPKQQHPNNLPPLLLLTLEAELLVDRVAHALRLGLLFEPPRALLGGLVLGRGERARERVGEGVLLLLGRRSSSSSATLLSLAPGGLGLPGGDGAVVDDRDGSG